MPLKWSAGDLEISSDGSVAKTMALFKIFSSPVGVGRAQGPLCLYFGILKTRAPKFDARETPTII